MRGTPLRSAYIEAVATEPELQGRGYASALLRQLAHTIAPYDLGARSPSDPVFYARLGWELWRGERFVERGGVVTPTPEYRVMVLRTPRTPTLDLDSSLTAPWREGDIW